MSSTKNRRFVQSLFISATVMSLTLIGLWMTAPMNATHGQERSRSNSAERLPSKGGIVRSPIELVPIESALGAACNNVLLDGGFEAGGIPSSIWNPETSTNFGTPLCDDAGCGTGGGSSPPRTGLVWAWFGGNPGPETATLGQTVTIASGSTATLTFWLRVGTVETPFTDVLNIKVDGSTVQTFTEPSVAEAAYTQRTVNLTPFANGAAHQILFEYIGTTSSTASFVVDDVTVDVCSAETPTPTPTPTPGPVNDTFVDFNGDGRTDFSVVRNTGGGPSGQSTWFNLFSNAAGSSQANWGLASDSFLTGDLDGDQKDDMIVWRPGAQATFYVLASGTYTIRVQDFGLAGDDPTVVADYDADGKDDLAVYRAGDGDTGLSFWYYATAFGTVHSVQFGYGQDFPAPGDYDGDGRSDFVLQRGEGAAGRFYKLLTTDGYSEEVFGLNLDLIVPGDYDGDGKTDVATIGFVGGFFVWKYEPSNTPGSTVISKEWGFSSTDFPVQGDYDGDGKTDFAVWRPDAQSNFYVITSVTNNVIIQPWGLNDDIAVGNHNQH